MRSLQSGGKRHDLGFTSEQCETIEKLKTSKQKKTFTTECNGTLPFREREREGTLS